MENAVILNVGCGMSIIPGAINIDNSLSVKLSKHKLLVAILKKLGLVKGEALSYVEFCVRNNVKSGSCTKLPVGDKSADVVYTSHMVEHLYYEDLVRFLNESYRVLKDDGVLRIALPDLRILIDNYTSNKDADSFMESLTMMDNRHKLKFKEKIRFMLIGDRLHKWMYDGDSFLKFVESHSKFKGCVVGAGETTIRNDMASCLDLNERPGESVYLEFSKI